MYLKFSALLGCQFWEKGLSVTNPVYFVPVCGGENLAWHQMPLNRCFSKQRQKTGASSSALLLLAPRFLPDKHIESVLSFIYLSRACFVSDPVAMVSASVWGRTCVYCIHYGMLRKDGADFSAGALWCHVQVCETLCFLMISNCLLRLSCKCCEQEAICRDAHHNSNSNWMGCTMSAYWPRTCGQTTWMCFCKWVCVSAVFKGCSWMRTRAWDKTALKCS